MKKKNRILIAILPVLLAALLSATLILQIAGSEPPFTGAALTYYQELMEKGFPADYAERLTRVHLLYPSWEFEPIRVTRSWGETVAMETKNPRTNLIRSGDAYEAYRHKTNQTVYDSGYYQASEAAVHYFLDPRNFLNEADLFQFYEQSATGERLRPRDLDPVLAGTFMDNATLENGKTYAEYLIEVGEEFGINPVFLAVKLRQEQGAGTSPLLSGKCGTLLDGYYRNQTAATESGKAVNPPKPGTLTENLTELDGYYNLFNVSASGDGVFNIYHNALVYAKSHGWNTKWKALRGGAEFLKQSYIGAGQSTVYLQKFDVFAAGTPHQYMQNVGGALSEGRLLYRFFAENGLTDRACTFRIPVYTGLPKAVAPDPAKGTCTTYATADTLYTYTAALTGPISGEAKKDAVFGSVQVNHNATLSLTGVLTHDYGADAFEYAWDGGEWLPFPDAGTMLLIIPPEELPAWGEHFLTVRVSHTYDKSRFATHTLCAAISVTVVPPPSVTLTLRSGNAEEVKERYEGDCYTFPVCNEPDFAGYAGSDGTLYPSGYELTLTHDVTYTAVFLSFTIRSGASLFIGDPDGSTHLRFEAAIPAWELDALPVGSMTFSATLFRNNVGAACDVTHSRVRENGSGLELICLRTPDLTDTDDLHDDFSVSFSLSLHYSDGTERTLNATGSSRRTAVMVASAALADQSADYPESVRAYLQKLLT